MSLRNLIAVDGPAASGKGTVSRRLAEHLNFAYLDTGLLYRATAAVVVSKGFDPHNEALCAQIAGHLDPDDMARDDLRTEATGRTASIVAAHPAVRATLLDYQRDFASSPPHGKDGAILDGRDIGTVVCPDAPAKLFITASPETRAERRFRQEVLENPDLKLATVLSDIRARDARDMDRATAPLVKAEDAVLIDTTNLGIDAAVDASFASVSKQLAL